ncbi:MAG TPA: non-homologous end-joining DNA ligase [Solirubrobacterales bacterium]|nr:non-homologous end-joining DNA ligase [Solirubrobacterales bacterium]
MTLFDALPAASRELLRAAPLPEAFEPMKATLTDRPFSSPDWVFERKLDGIRSLVIRDGDRVRLVSRTGRVQTGYPELEEALLADDCRRFVADGEIVALDEGRTSFERLQGRMGIADPSAARRTGIEIFIYLFDLVWIEGKDTRALPLVDRKELLETALTTAGPVGRVPHVEERGQELFQQACAAGFEGLIAKRRESPYVCRRSRDWLKLKCQTEQEFVIGGFTAPQGKRKEFGALLVGYNEGGELRYAGKVGTGFDAKTLRDLGQRLRSLERERNPFPRGQGPRGARWVAPELVAQVGFSEWTRDGKLRHPRFLGLRDDKRPEEVVRERPGAGQP